MPPCQCHQRLQQCFGQQILRVKDNETGENQIVFGLKQVLLPPRRSLGLRALDLQHKTQLDFLSLLTLMSEGQTEEIIQYLSTKSFAALDGSKDI